MFDHSGQRSGVEELVVACSVTADSERSDVEELDIVCWTTVDRGQLLRNWSLCARPQRQREVSCRGTGHCMLDHSGQRSNVEELDIVCLTTADSERPAVNPLIAIRSFENDP